MEDDGSPPTSPLLTLSTNTIKLQASEQNHQRSSSRNHQNPLEEVWVEMKRLLSIAFPMILTGLLLYGKSAISMLFMGRLGTEALAGGSLAIAFANITGYSILSGLASGMEPIASQAFGAKRFHLVGHALQRTTTILLASSVIISFLWLHSERILLLCGQDPAITAIASTYLVSCAPTLFLQSFIHPLKIYLRSQNLLLPLTSAACLALVLHVPISYLFVCLLGLGTRGIAMAAIVSDLSFASTMVAYLHITSSHCKSWPGWSLSECFKQWQPLLSLAAPSCVTVCLEWWWYELMIILSGLLDNAADAVAAMGILMQVTSLVYVVPSALGLAVSTRVGHELGAGRPERAQQAAKVALGCAAAAGAAAAGAAVVGRGKWGWAFTGDAAVARLAAAAMPVVGLCELGNCPQTAGCGALRGSARPGLGAGINMGAFYGVGMPVAVAIGLRMGMGLVGLWMGMVAAQAACAAAVVWVVVRMDWGAEARRAKDRSCGGGGMGVRVDEEEGFVFSSTVCSPKGGGEETESLASCMPMKVVLGC
ncbi:protein DETOXIFICATION 49-like [Phoenix dactylifera]|uniref:Protein DETOXIFICATION n=1 Tax=Phoenix dactylifera TaxID=42345 RepID=A0A8B9AGY0_PHODC|nr:protein DETOXIFICATION 49-like [Phoenix dactylifera]